MEPFVLPPSTEIGSVTLRVPDIRESLPFYRDLLGFDVADVQGSRTALTAKQSAKPLVFLSEERNAIPRPPRTTGLFHAAFLFPNRRELAEVFLRLQSHGWPFQGFADHGVSEALYLADPHGIGIELYVDRPREQWPFRNGILHMVTESLDLDSLLGELERPEAETGTGESVRVGHIHLNVSDLTKARHFYHDLLGFSITQETYPGALFVAAGGYHHHLGLNTWNGRGAPTPPHNAIGLVHFELMISDQSSLAILEQRLLAEHVPITKRPDGLETHDHDGISLSLHN